MQTLRKIKDPCRTPLILMYIPSLVNMDRPWKSVVSKDDSLYAFKRFVQYAQHPKTIGNLRQGLRRILKHTNTHPGVLDTAVFMIGGYSPQKLRNFFRILRIMRSRLVDKIQINLPTYDTEVTLGRHLLLETMSAVVTNCAAHPKHAYYFCNSFLFFIHPNHKFR
jgi:hypothetical protein